MGNPTFQMWKFEGDLFVMEKGDRVFVVCNGRERSPIIEIIVLFSGYDDNTKNHRYLSAILNLRCSKGFRF